MEGPYRDLGSGFARLTGVEGLRRSPARLRSVEDALYELLRNSRDAGARNIYVASALRARRYRQLVVIDDGGGIPETHKHLVFEPGVTSRHLDPAPNHEDRLLHGAGLSLYHVKNAALSAEVLSASSPTSIRAVFDTRTLPEKSLQTPGVPAGAKTQKTNIPATLASFVQQQATASPNPPRLYHASPARVLARLLKNRIIQKESTGDGGRLREEARRLGLEVSLRTVQRVVAGEVPAAEEVSVGCTAASAGGTRSPTKRNGTGGPILSVGAEELDQILAVLRRSARSSYLDLAGLDVEKRPGELILRARFYEPEDEYG